MDDPSALITAGKLLAVLLLVLANGFFVAAEFSLVAMRRSRVEQLIAEGHRLAPPVQRAVQHLDAYLAATQLGITIASLGLGWIGEPVLAALIEPALHFIPDNWALIGSHTIAVAIAFAIITTLHIVLGELAPKSLALQRTEGTALAVGRPLELFLVLFRPAIYFLNGLGNLVLRLFGLRPAGDEALVHSVGELKLLISARREAGFLGKEAEEILERAFEFDDIAARQVMVPRVEMVGVSVDTTLEDVMAKSAECHHTRLPVWEESLDNIVGIAGLVDIVRASQQAGDSPKLHEVMRPALSVPEMIPADKLLGRMRAERAQMAILVDEYGGTAGLVTIHDLVERLVGPLLDGQEVAQDGIELLSDGGALVGGMALVHDVGERFGLHIDDDAYDTVGGFVQTMLGRMPVQGDEVRVGDHVFRVESLDGKRVDKLRLIKLGLEAKSRAEHS